MAKITGIYKITSPVGKIYIGQSRNIRARINIHKCKTGIRFNRPICDSLKHYGQENHTFEIVHQLPFDVSSEVLDAYEQLYMDLYKDCGIELLNLKEAGMNGAHHEATKQLLSKQRIGVKKSEEHRRKIGESNKISQIGNNSGEENPKAKLALSQVEEIRKRHQPNIKGANLLLSIEFGVSVSTIERITSKTSKARTWVR